MERVRVTVVCSPVRIVSRPPELEVSLSDILDAAWDPEMDGEPEDPPSWPWEEEPDAPYSDDAERPRLPAPDPSVATDT